MPAGCAFVAEIADIGEDWLVGAVRAVAVGGGEGRPDGVGEDCGAGDDDGSGETEYAKTGCVACCETSVELT